VGSNSPCRSKGQEEQALGGFLAGYGGSDRTPCGTRSSPPRSTPASLALRDVQEAASHADPRTTMRYDRARVSLDRHATYIVATFIAGAAR